MMNPAASSLVISFLIASFLSGEKRCNLCLTGLELAFNSNLCSAKSLGTPSISAGFHTKMSLLSLRNLVSVNSYFLESWVLMIAILEASLASNAIFLVGSSSTVRITPDFLVRISMSLGFV